jgi:hypothetical protein
MFYVWKNGKIFFEHWALVEDLSDSDRSKLEEQLRDWDLQNRLSELAEYPQALSWFIILLGCAVLESYKGLHRPICLVGPWPPWSLIFTSKINDRIGIKDVSIFYST